MKEPIEYIPSEIFVKIASGGDHLVLLTLDGRIYTAGKKITIILHSGLDNKRF